MPQDKKEAKAMSHRRDILFNVNRPQERILYPFYVSCLLILAFLIAMAYLLIQHPLFRQSGNYQTLLMSQEIGGVRALIVVLGFMVAVILFALIFWAYHISNQILGPYERIVRELDLIISGKGRKLLQVRRNDEMFAELVERINVLIAEKLEQRFSFDTNIFDN
jgi:hypothetical protein